MFWSRLLGFFIFILSRCDAVRGDNSAKLLFNRLLKDYIQSDPPDPNKPTEVRIGMYVNNIAEVDDGDNMQTTLTFYMRQHWKDPRLQFNPTEVGGQKSIRLPDEGWKQIWIPDIFFRNAVQIDKMETMREHVLLKLNSTGFLWFVYHLTVKFSCPMRLERYPFDTQMCSIMFESFGHTMDTLHISWLSNPFEIDESVQVHQFSLQKTILYDCSQNYTSGAFPCLEVQMVLRHDPGFYFVQIFLPSILVVIMSWFCLWVDMENYAQRFSVICILVLTLVVQGGFYSRGVAKVSYVKALDVWMILCVLFVFAVLLESTVVMVLGSSKTTGKYENMEGTVSKVNNPRVARLIDVISRAAFPVVFLLTLIVFFAVYRGCSHC